MHTRILELRKTLKLSQQEFAEKIGLKANSISDLENGKTAITERTIILICSIYNVNEEWLRFGSGNMFNVENKKYSEFFEIYNNLNPILQEYLLSCANNLLDVQNKLNKE